MAAAKLKNIDLQNPHLLNAPAKFTIAGLVVAGGFGIGFFWGFKREKKKFFFAGNKKERTEKDLYEKEYRSC